MAGGRASKKNVQLAQRRALALSFRRQGAAYRKIAEEMRNWQEANPDTNLRITGAYNESNAYRDVIEELDRVNAENNESAMQLRRMNVMRLEDLYSRMYPKAANGDPFFVDRCIQLIDRMARYSGIDSPTKLEVTGKDGEPLANGMPPVVIMIPDNGRDDLKGVPTIEASKAASLEESNDKDKSNQAASG